MKYFLTVALALFSAVASAQESDKQTDTELFLAFGKDVQETMNYLDPSVMDGAFDMKTLGKRITKDVEVDSGFREGFLEGVGQSAKIGQQIVEAIAADGSYSFLGMRERDGKPHLLFRMLADGALNYHELEVVRRKGERVQIVDAFFYLSGEYYSETLRRVFVRAAAEQSRGVISKLMGSDGEFLDNIDKIDRFNELVAAGEFQKALDLYDKLPESVRHARFMQMSRIMAAQSVSDELYGTCLDEYLKLFPGDASLSLLMIDAYMIREEYSEALKTIDKLDASVGVDPYLDCLRSNILFAMGEVDDALAKARRACKGQPRLEDTWWTLVGIGLGAERWDAVADGLDGLREHCQTEFNDLSVVPEFAGFAASEVGKAWIARQVESEAEQEEG